MSNLTQHANDLLEFKYPDWMNIISVYEDLGHDGFDEDGPESDIWDLWIYYEKNGKRLVDNWHWEQWYSPIPSLEGYLDVDDCFTYTPEQLRFICPHLFEE